MGLSAFLAPQVSNASGSQQTPEYGRLRGAFDDQGELVLVRALLLSTGGPDLLSIPWHGLDIVISPLRVALCGLGFLWFVCLVLSREKPFAWAAAGTLLIALSGHAPSSMASNWASVFPETALELGVALIVAAFAFLALGLAKSLLPPRTTSSSPGRRLVSS